MYTKNPFSAAPFSVVGLWAPEPGAFISSTGRGIKEWEGWTLCDGRNGTPDLRGSFLRGAGLSPSPVTAGQRGGHDSVKLEIKNLAPHDHRVTLKKDGAHEHTAQPTALADNDDFDGTGHYIGARDHGDAGTSTRNITDEGSAHKHTIVQQTVGKGIPIQTVPPYVGMLFMIRLPEKS